MMNQGQGTEPAYELIVSSSYNCHAVRDSIAAIVKTFGREFILASPIDEFG